jgi:twinkle protein
MFEKFLEYGIDTKGRSGDLKLTCPKCSPTRKNKSDRCLSVNTEKGLYNCHHCDWSGNVNLTKKKEYIKPVKVNADVSERLVKWFAKRGVSEATVAHWKIGESKEYFPQIEKRRNAVNFNYYRKGELVNVKFRDAEKNFKMVKDAELIFYGLDNIKEMDTIYITEGEMDALSLHEAGIYSVCSVPNGASLGNQRLDYLDNCYEYFEKKKCIILCTDNDQAGLQLRNELARRFGQHRCKYIEFGEFKDANEILVSKGPTELREILNKPKTFPVEGIVNIDDIWDNVLNFNDNGIKNYDIKIGDSKEYINISMGEWSVVTGIPNAGKSDWIDQVCVNLATNQNFRIGMFTPESYPYEAHIKRIANKLNERDCDNDTLNNTKDFIKEHFYFVKIDLNNLSLKSILDKFKQLVFTNGINICVIDPWNMLDHSQQKDFTYVGKLLSEITQFCQQTKTHLFLVAHPRKMESNEGKYRVPNPYDISQSSDFFNKAYNCVTVYRNIGQKTIYGSDSVSIYVQKVKRKENGKQGDFMIAPDFNNGGVYKSIDKHKQRFEVIKDNIPF